MNIMFEDSITDEIKTRYILLPLDTFHFNDININRTAYCLIENTPIMEMFDVDRYLNLHHTLLHNYAKKNWLFCETAIENLKGRWNEEVDSFYENLLERVTLYKENDPGDSWTAVIPAKC